MMRNIKVTCVISVCLFCFNTFSQDIHFSQFYMSPVNLNPALAGNFIGDQRVCLNYKNQWETFGAPYRTYAFSFDAGMMKKKWSGAYLGVGLNATSDKAGDVGLSTTDISLSVSGIVKISDNQNLSGGLQCGLEQKSITGSELHWGNQYNGLTYDASLPGESTPFSSDTYGNYSAGLAYNYVKNPSTLSANDNLMINAGVGLWHINNPEQALYLYGQPLYRKLLVHGQLHYGVPNTVLAIRPSFMVALQGESREEVFGTWVRYMIRENSRYTGLLKEIALSAGAFYRYGDAFVPGLLMEYANFALGVSYDVNTSGLRTASTGKGGIEISIRFVNPNPFNHTDSNVRFL